MYENIKSSKTVGNNIKTSRHCGLDPQSISLNHDFLKIFRINRIKKTLCELREKTLCTLWFSLLPQRTQGIHKGHRKNLANLINLAKITVQDKERAEGEVIIDVSHLANGMYFLKVGNQVVKFIKE